jgi:hypothetical protein
MQKKPKKVYGSKKILQHHGILESNAEMARINLELKVNRPYKNHSSTIEGVTWSSNSHCFFD